MTPLEGVPVVELARRMWFAGLVALLGAVASWHALVRRSPPQPVAVAPVASAHDPAAEVPPSGTRDPFMTGAEWRAWVRARTEPAPSPAPSAATPRPPAPPPSPPPVLKGTMISERHRYAVIGGGVFPEGAVVSGYRIESIDMESVVLVRGQERLTLTVPSRATHRGRKPD